MTFSETMLTFTLPSRDNDIVRPTVLPTFDILDLLTRVNLFTERQGMRLH